MMPAARRMVCAAAALAGCCASALRVEQSDWESDDLDLAMAAEVDNKVRCVRCVQVTR